MLLFIAKFIGSMFATLCRDPFSERIVSVEFVRVMFVFQKVGADETGFPMRQKSVKLVSVWNEWDATG